MQKFGYEPNLVIANSLPTQSQWLRENNIPFKYSRNWVHEIVKKQIEHIKPNVLYLPNPVLFDSRFVRSLAWKPQLILGWKASSIPPDTDWSEFDVMLSCLSPLLKVSLQLGAKAAEYFYPGYPAWINEQLPNKKACHDVVFCGLWTKQTHKQRNSYLQSIATAAKNPETPFSCSYYLSGKTTDVPLEIAQFNRGSRFGIDLHKTMLSGRIAIDARATHKMRVSGSKKVIDLGGEDTANMRIFEATGSGVFLLTEHFDNLNSFFEPGDEIETYRNKNELIDKIHYYLEHPQQREAIAVKGQKRCLEDHSIEKRAEAFNRIIKKHLKKISPSLHIGTTDNQVLSKTESYSVAQFSNENNYTEDPYDTAYKWGWSNPKLKQLVYHCYKTPDFTDNAHRFFNSAEFKTALNILSNLGKHPDKDHTVLDFGCGNGIATYSLARAGYSVVGIDSSLGEIAGLMAAQKLQGLDNTTFNLQHSTTKELAFPDNSFDIVWLREVLHHMNNLTAFLKDVFRVLKPNGIVCSFRDHVIWNEEQKDNFFKTHPFYHITKDEGCFYLEEYRNAYLNSGFIIEKEFDSHSSIINTYPRKFDPSKKLDIEKAKLRKNGNDPYSFFARKYN
jgi:2-polyprenyl-3-methyl-5-hydroxy-6-metoxy-1,4-benzoquinol methylase